MHKLAKEIGAEIALLKVAAPPAVPADQPSADPVGTHMLKNPPAPTGPNPDQAKQLAQGAMARLTGGAGGPELGNPSGTPPAPPAMEVPPDQAAADAAGGAASEAQPGIMAQIGQKLKDLHGWGMGGAGQGYGESWNKLTAPLDAPGTSVMGNVGKNIGGAWNALPGYGKLGLGAGAAGLGAMGLSALLGRKEKRRPVSPAQLEVQACWRAMQKRAGFDFDKLRKTQGMGPGNGGVQRGGAKSRAMSIGSKGKRTGSKGGPGCGGMKPMGSFGKKVRGSCCGKSCHSKRGSAADFGASLACC